MSRALGLLLLGVIWIGLSFSSKTAYGFAENLRHGYSNCLTCHSNINGGGIVTAYGRGLSAELMSTWGQESEAQFLWGKVKTPEWLAMSADFRAVQTYVDTPSYKEGRWIPMQADLEASAKVSESLEVVATFGRDYTPPPRGIRGHTSRRHYLKWTTGEEYHLQAGKFEIPYGLGLAEHIFFVKRSLGFDEGTESYNIQASWIAEFWNLTVLSSFGRPDRVELQAEKGSLFKIERLLADSFKIGATYYRGQSESSDRELVGLHGNLAFNERWYWMTEVDLETPLPRQSSGPKSPAVAYFNRVGYEATKGLQVQAVLEGFHRDLSQNSNKRTAVGLGVAWMPRPHLDFSSLWEKVYNPSMGQDPYDSAWLMSHVYF